jgi:hypothetical protein
VGTGIVIVDKIEEFYRHEAERMNKKPRNVFRASSAGYCERRLGYEKLGFQGEAMTPRRMAVLRHGSTLDWAFKKDLAKALGDKYISLDDLPYNFCELDGVKIWFMPDGAFQADNDDIGIVENKTMSDWGFDRALRGEIDRAYLCQAWLYHYGTSFNPIVFVCYRKETSHFCEVVFDRRATETVVTQRFGGDPMQLAVDDPMLIAEIRSPFDPSVEEEVRGKFARLMKLTTEADLAPQLILNDRGEPVIGPETISIQGKDKAAAFAKENDLLMASATQSGSWYKFTTGRQVANFPCSYCGFVRRCLGARLEINNGKPKWIIPNTDTLKQE